MNWGTAWTEEESWPEKRADRKRVDRVRELTGERIDKGRRWTLDRVEWGQGKNVHFKPVTRALGNWE